MTAEERVREYVRQRAMAKPGGKVTGIDPELINGVFYDPDAAMANLNLSDLEAVLDELDRTRRLLHSLTQDIS